MRIILSLLLIQCLFTLGYAQPSLDSTDFVVDFNEKIIVKISKNYHTIVSGANVVWDFSDLDTSAYKTDTIQFIPIDSVCNASLLPGGEYYGLFTYSNTYMKLGNTITAYSNMSSALTIEGDELCSSFLTFYNHTKMVMTFPFTFNSSINNSYSGETLNVPYPYNIIDGNVNVIADGYGTLILPSMTFNNVLKVSVTDIHHNPNLPKDTIHYSIWYGAGIPYTILKIYNNDYARYIDGFNTYVDREQYSNSISVYPNPASYTVEIDMGERADDLSYKLIDVLGKVVSTERIINTNKFSIDISSLETGIYFLRMNYKEKLIIKKIIKN